jgi:hypothetical protein
VSVVVTGYETSIGVIEFTTQELKLLSDHERAFLFSASLILNDMRFHWSLLGRSPMDDQDELLKTMQVVRQLWLLRKLSAAICEANQTIGEYVGKLPFLRELVGQGLSILQNSPHSKDYLKLAGRLRNKTAYHYNTKELASNIDTFSDNEVHRLFAHKQQGNSISAICEQVLTGPTIVNAFQGSTMDGFHDWCMESSNSIVVFCNKSLGQLILKRFPQKSYYEHVLRTTEEARPAESRWPLLMVVDRK